MCTYNSAAVRMLVKSGDRLQDKANINARTVAHRPVSDPPSIKVYRLFSDGLHPRPASSLLGCTAFNPKEL